MDFRRSGAFALPWFPRSAGGATVAWGCGRPHQFRSRQGHGRRAAAARRLVQARAPRPDDDRRPQRRGQDDAAADARRADLDRRRRARAREGRARRAARPAPAARARPVAARLRAVGLQRADRARGASSPRSSRRWARATSARSSSYAGVQARFETAGGYTLARGRHERRARPRLRRRRPRPPAVDVLRRRADARLAGARAGRRSPDLLLLDEPTNHLDIESLEWLEETLVGLDAAVVLVAHDRWFLEAVGTCVLELEAGRARFFKGPWHAWRKEQAARELALGKAIARQEAEIARMERFVERFRAKATQGQAGAGPRRRSSSKIEAGRITRDPQRHARAGLPVQEARALGPRDLRARARRASRSAIPAPRTLLHEAELWLERGEHVSLVGPNGTGKTTLIEALAGQRAARRGPAEDRAQRQGRLPLPARRGARVRRRAHGARGRRQAHRADAERGARAARPLPLLRRGGREAARRASAAASASAWASRSSSAAAPTC